MNGRVIFEVGLWGAAIVVTCVAALGSHRESLSIRNDRYSVPVLPAVPQKLPEKSVVAAMHDAIEKNPFRFERRPAAVPFGARATPNPAAEYESDAAHEPPRLILRGILGGPPWEALLEGIPGLEGSVLVKVGDRFGALRVRSIDAEIVVVQSTDAAWRLTLDAAWP